MDTSVNSPGAGEQYSDRYNTVISADENGFIEYWEPTMPFEKPMKIRGLWSFKSETDLFEFKKVNYSHVIPFSDLLTNTHFR